MGGLSVQMIKDERDHKKKLDIKRAELQIASRRYAAALAAMETISVS